MAPIVATIGIIAGEYLLIGGQRRIRGEAIAAVLPGDDLSRVELVRYPIRRAARLVVRERVLVAPDEQIVRVRRRRWRGVAELVVRRVDGGRSRYRRLDRDDVGNKSEGCSAADGRRRNSEPWPRRVIGLCADG